MLSPNKIFALLCVGSVIVLPLYIHDAKTRVADTTNVVAAVASTASEAPSPPAPAQISESAASANEATRAGEPARTEPTHITKKAALADGKPSRGPSGPSKRVFFRYNGVDSHYGRLAFIQLERPEQPQFVDSLSCEVAYVAGGRGICLTANRGVFTTYAAKLFDGKTFQVLSEFRLKGVPSRSRVSADGRTAALTVFVSGHGYDSLDFSTQTLLVEVEQGRILADLEEFEVTRDEKPFANKDFNFWGVTFTPDAANFYATLSTKGEHLLVRGDIARRSAVVVHTNVECPSLSPDGARVAYKKRTMERGRVVWQLYLLDLATQRETPLGERRSIDDQLEWLDNDHVLYAVSESASGPSASTEIWKVNAEAAGTPTLFLRKAYSPSVVVAAQRP